MPIFCKVQKLIQKIIQLNPMKKTLLTLALVTGLTLFAGNLKAANLIQNGNFDNGFSGWISSGNVSITSYYNSSSVYNPNNWDYPWVDIKAPYGIYTANNFAQLGIPNGGYGVNTLSQSFDTIIGNTYTVSFAANGRTDRGSDYFIASIGTLNLLNKGSYNDVGSGVVVDRIEGWANYSTNFSATQTTSTLTFTTQNRDSAYGVGMISVQSVPEPSTYALLGIGAIGMLMVLRKKKTA
jgi:hypothetical protein